MLSGFYFQVGFIGTVIPKAQRWGVKLLTGFLGQILLKRLYIENGQISSFSGGGVGGDIIIDGLEKIDIISAKILSNAEIGGKQGGNIQIIRHLQ